MIQRLFRRAYWGTGWNLRRLEVIVRALPKLWFRPFDFLNLHGTGAEIGAYRGMHAKDMLRRHPEIIELWLVDPYTDYCVPPTPE